MEFLFLIFFLTIGSLSVVPITCRRAEVCYDEVGCFNLEPPWFSLTRPLPAPQSPEKIKLQFYLATRNTAHKPVRDWKLLTTDFYKPFSEDLSDLDYQNTRKRTAVHIHGMYMNDEWNWRLQKRLAMAYLHKEDVNVIFVKYDAKILKLQNIYFQLVANIRVVAAIAARFFKHLMKLTNLSSSQIHLIGFSLGAHVAGYIGKIIPNIYRITGLDPAKPLFENADPLYRLARTDAKFVDVLHTNTIMLIPFGGLGYRPPFGDVDFYFNNGFIQPGCIIKQIGRVLKKYLKLQLRRAFIHTYFLIVCSHLRVVDYWIESIENSHCIMWGIETNSERSKTEPPRVHGSTQHRCTPVGLRTFEYATSGQYYVPTRMASPYCISRYNLDRIIRGPKFSFDVGYYPQETPPKNDEDVRLV